MKASPSPANMPAATHLQHREVDAHISPSSMHLRSSPSSTSSNKPATAPKNRPAGSRWPARTPPARARSTSTSRPSRRCSTTPPSTPPGRCTEVTPSPARSRRPRTRSRGTRLSAVGSLLKLSLTPVTIRMVRRGMLRRVVCAAVLLVSPLLLFTWPERTC